MAAHLRPLSVLKLIALSASETAAWQDYLCKLRAMAFRIGGCHRPQIADSIPDSGWST